MAGGPGRGPGAAAPPTHPPGVPRAWTGPQPFISRVVSLLHRWMPLVNWLMLSMKRFVSILNVMTRPAANSKQMRGNCATQKLDQLWDIEFPEYFKVKPVQHQLADVRMVLRMPWKPKQTYKPYKTSNGHESSDTKIRRPLLARAPRLRDWV